MPTPFATQTIATTTSRIRWLQRKLAEYIAANTLAERSFAELAPSSSTWFGQPGRVSVTRELAMPVVRAARELEPALNRLRLTWAAARDIANAPARHQLEGTALANFRREMMAGDEAGRNATWQLERYYQSRWYEGNPQRVPAWIAYAGTTILPDDTSGIVETITELVQGKEYTDAQRRWGPDEGDGNGGGGGPAISPWLWAGLGLAGAAALIIRDMRK